MIIPLVLAVVWGFRSEVAALSAIIGGGLTAAVWTWVLNEPFGVTGLVAGIVINIVAFVTAYVAFGKRERRSTTIVSEGE